MDSCQLDYIDRDMVAHVIVIIMAVKYAKQYAWELMFSWKGQMFFFVTHGRVMQVIYPVRMALDYREGGGGHGPPPCAYVKPLHV